MIRLDGITKTFGETTAVDDITIHFPNGKTTAVIGPSGCGKSTLLRLIIGLVEADEGTVTVGSHTIRSDTPPDVRHRMGYVIQDGGLFPHLTGYGNVAILARHLRWSTGQLERRTKELADLVQLPLDRLEQYPNELSGGQRQRISLMRALMLDPDVLLLDEPLGALDPMIRADLQSDLRNIFQTLKKTVVFVTHDLSEAAFIADRIVLLRRGQIVQTGSMSDLLKSPQTAFAHDFVQAQRSSLV